ncbi:MAG: hypothetical protein A3A98_00345 [Candidatus Staskawiczbacteria bacterium RIFCSPLOWO2_01_FULL_40_39]|uniref:Uncharacterized protein n=1 Tax=Candidatus Staskawiczbacteria bacterium RIFCSPHIGHO2_01_FULL_39_25 TaxID=1802202 RepID=A0A1G2HPB6_9BACT|nr:MAG: hypothetical protein A2730_00345 [Candidatus Staskawiczbacteria bacterium RIFCSPHIGHO2_01_FULL_39_25]OGZ73185.1 MAG: hypothetical protein A3A98_00345 [Candidatus Staskawiczbacteria bacterium RIFCSPLOWO2_01_FULL_40_39]OGZ76004.1 MAG: hypothetical protein A3I87_01525 [Candidatus Staskawiczbacteria bacterium RIFCSPLOWO2_02_FULL_39_8]
MQMPKKYKKVIVVLIFIAVILPQSTLILASEVNYPPIPGAPSPTDLFSYIAYFITFAVVAAGIMGVVSIVIAGIKILINAGSPAAIGDAKDRIFGAILGIILLMASFIILRTINAELVNERTIAPDLKAGAVYYTVSSGLNEDGELYIQAPEAESNTANIPQPYDTIYYYCEGNPANYRNLLVWVYNDFNFQIDRNKNGGADVNTIVLPCNQGTPILDTILSFKRSYEYPGIYLYLTNKCTGVSSPSLTLSGDVPRFDAQANKEQRPKSLRIVNGKDPRQIYGVIFNKNPKFTGECTRVVWNPQPNIESECIILDGQDAKPNVFLTEEKFLPESMYVVNFDIDLGPRAGGSIELYSKDYIARIPQKAGPSNTTSVGTDAQRNAAFDIGNVLHIKNPVEGQPTPDALLRKPFFKGIGVRFTATYPDTVEESYANGSSVGARYYEYGSATTPINGQYENYPEGGGGAQCNDYDYECIRKIKHNGTYYTIFYAHNNLIGGEVCVVNTKSTNLRDTKILDNNKVITEITIIPTTP